MIKLRSLDLLIVTKLFFRKYVFAGFELRQEGTYIRIYFRRTLHPTHIVGDLLVAWQGHLANEEELWCWDYQLLLHNEQNHGNRNRYDLEDYSLDYDLRFHRYKPIDRYLSDVIKRNNLRTHNPYPMNSVQYITYPDIYIVFILISNSCYIFIISVISKWLKQSCQIS